MPGLWRIPSELRPVTEPPRLSDSAKLQIALDTLAEIERILRDGIPRRAGSKARIPIRDRDRVVLARIAAALALGR